MPFTVYRQLDSNDCGPTCLRMVARHYGRTYPIDRLRQLAGIDREGVDLLGLSRAAGKIGFSTEGIRLSAEELKKATLPCILHWHQNHFVVLYKVKHNKFYIADPAGHSVRLSIAAFNRNWNTTEPVGDGIALLLVPTPLFYETAVEQVTSVNWHTLFGYFVTYKKLLIKLLLSLLAGSLLQLVVPFLTQSVVDTGVRKRDINFVALVLIAQLALMAGRVTVDFIRSWLLLHISTRVNIAVITDFLIKLMRLPLSFFENKNTGDIMQRINDQRVIQSFLTGSTLNTAFSLITLLVFAFVLARYNMGIFLVFVVSSTIYITWITWFLKYRRKLNYKNFDVSAKNQSNIIQLVTGMQEIKLNNCEEQKRLEWESLQLSLYKLNRKGLVINQYQQGGSTFINEGTNLLITFLSARAVINGHLTLGAMVAVQYMVGQLNSPVQQFLGFIQGYQDAKISMERLNEIHQLQDEEPPGRLWKDDLQVDKSITLQNVTFAYNSNLDQPVLQNINLHIPHGKTTALVGMSGSGKTTLIKLLLRFYEPQQGAVLVGGEPLNQVSFKTWRSCCGVVMQDSFIFSDTIARNIAVGEDEPDADKLLQAIKVANINDLIDSVPAGLNTRIGTSGSGISQGQRQRLLIARAVYKNPDYLFLDEATNALDATNERIIYNNLQEFYRNRTVLIVAHRLSTVTNADNIIVLDKGEIIEQGTHAELTALKGLYYNLIKNQLEMGN